jgi:hypothetical protein
MGRLLRGCFENPLEAANFRFLDGSLSVKSITLLPAEGLLLPKNEDL